MNRRTLFTLVFIVLMGFVLARVFVHVDDARQQEYLPERVMLELPELDNAYYDWIGSRIYQNEALGRSEYLTHWNKGEDFPSLGIGHFIWFPEGVDAPFDEQFPALAAYLDQQVPEELRMPAWLQELDPFDAPWKSKEQFDEDQSSARMASLRQWLEATRLYQARFIVSAFERRWREMELPGVKNKQLTRLLQNLVETPQGLFAVIDYYNFKGLGNNPRETYQGQGWGLLQVLEALAVLRMDEEECSDIVAQFRDAAAGRLRLRVQLSPPGRNEKRWLDGWMKRLDAYVEEKPEITVTDHCGFHITPYVQNPARDAITLIWFSKDDGAGQIRVWSPDTEIAGNAVLLESSPARAEALFYHPAERCLDEGCRDKPLPFLHQVRLVDLKPGTNYRYEVVQGAQQSGGSFSTLGDDDQSLRFIVYADSETEPESTGKHVPWMSLENPTRSRRYPVDQTTGYAQNLDVIRSRNPDFVGIAGDLVQSGGEQRDWDEFWLHNAELAASTVLLPALGNHDYYGGPGDLGNYATADSERAVLKYQTYFDLPSNGANDPRHSERYYSLQLGVITLIVLDTNNGLPNRGDMDTNWRLLGEGEGGIAPDWQPGSEQYAWLQKELIRAQEASRFTFIMFHGVPYTSGAHGRSPAEKPRGDIFSAQPLQVLTPLFLEHGVDAVFGGHDEMYEHSVLAGTEISPNGEERAHEIHYFDIGIGGDGLRGPVKDMNNPHQVFLAHNDAPELYSSNGVLQDGGKHYGHLEINVQVNSNGAWQARIDPVYIFPILEPNGAVAGYERRLYDDPLTLTALQ